MSTNKNISRRNFINKAGITAAGVTLGASTLPAWGHGSVAANDKINIGVIGTGGRGSWAVKVAQSRPEIDVIACCDILPSHLETGLAQAAKGAKGYEDYRKMLENKDIDAIVVSTPLHLHYEMAMDALDAEKHVYCEKTMTYDIPQSIGLTKKAKASKSVFQVGYQQRVSPLFTQIKKLLGEGYLGKVTHVECTWNRNGDWRREVPSPELERLINWRMYREYSGGLMAELSSHQIDVINWMLEAHPTRVVGMGGVDYWKDGRETFDNASVIFDYPEGIKAKFTCLTTNQREGFSVKLYCTKATVEVNRAQGQQGFIYPEPIKDMEAVDGVSGATMKAIEAGEPIPIYVPEAGDDDSIPTGNAFEHFASCIHNNKTPNASVEVGHLAGVATHMANISMHNGTVETWKDEYDMV